MQKLKIVINKTKGGDGLDCRFEIDDLKFGGLFVVQDPEHKMRKFRNRIVGLVQVLADI